ncbi:MAG TPA: radical SAM protein [Stellaceae bacterium]|nr:radical SAM protein [Stellaceae bacterium]
MTDSCNVLMIYPKFNPKSFWSFDGACEMLGARYPAAPLGMITLAALLPSSWTVRLVNRNTEETPAELAWADMVMTGGMLAQRIDALKVIALAQRSGKTVIVGGPDVTSSPQAYAAAEIRVLGEAETIIDEFVAAWDRGERSGLFEGPKFQADITKTPIPRFDLLKRSDYLYLGVQFSRGCPFMCEFCDIIELYGRVPRTKTSAQMLAELDVLYEIGWRGHLDFVDDNLIGNKKAVKAFLPDLIAWQKRHDYPFLFTTEASINLADDLELMRLMHEANFHAVFVGIESPEEATLVHMQKKQNTRRSIPESIHRIYEAGLIVAAGFIVGFDTEKGSVANAMVRCVEDAMIPIANISLLYALAGTQLTRRLEREGRLYADYEMDEKGNAGDYALAGLNFDTVRPRREILGDFAAVLSAVYEPNAFFGRVRRMALALKPMDLGLRIRLREAWREIDRLFAILWHVTRYRPEMRRHVWRVLGECAIKNPLALRAVVAMSHFYIFLGPLSRLMVERAQARIAEIDAENARGPGPSQPAPVSIAATAA